MKRLLNYLPFIIIIGVSLLLFFSNYLPGTYLIGWDNIMPEFDLWLNIKRNIFAVWQDYRGLGLLDGQAHSANLIHTIFITFLRLFFSAHIVRYLLTILLHCFGGISMFYLSSLFTKKRSASIIAALFYMLNIGIIQQFYAPLETFVFQFAFMPIVIYWAYLYIQNRSRKALMWFSFFSVLMTPQSFVPTVFIVSFWGLLFLSSLDIVQNHSVKRFMTLLFATLAINSFWLVPYLYDLPEKSKTVQNARINEFSSEETFQRNKARGGLLDVLSMKGFMLDIKEYDDTKNLQVDFMQIWNNYSKSILYISAFSILLGIIATGFIFNFHNQLLLPIYGLFFMSFVFLGTDIPIISLFNSFIRDRLPMFGEAVRFPFTKFITTFALTYSLFLGLGISKISQLLSEQKIKRPFFGFCLLLIFLVAAPAFTGNFFSHSLRKEVPSDYKMAFEYLKNYDNQARIAVLPTHTFWSWQSKNWGYLGSGFEWFGIPQPILVRAFDPWSTKNEQFYNEISYAISSQDSELLLNVLEKYHISLLLMDKSINNELSNKPIHFDKLEDFLISTKSITLLQEFNDISLFKVNGNNSSTSFVSNPIRIGSMFERTKIDTTYQNQKINIYDTDNPNLVFPFPSLLTENLKKNREFDIAFNSDAAILSTRKNGIHQLPTNAYLTIPSLFTNEELIPAKFTLNKNQLHVQILYPEFYLDDEKINISGEEFNFPIKNSNENDSIVINSDTEIKSGGIAHIQNHIINVFKIKHGRSEELIEFDTTSMNGNPLYAPIQKERVDTFKVILPLIKDSFAYSNVISQLNLQTIEHQNESSPDGCAKRNIQTARVEFNQLFFETVCDQVEVAYSLDALPHNASYLLFVKAKHITGLPISVYVNNEYEQRTELQGKLEKETINNAFTLYPSQKVFQGYGLHFLSQSLNRNPSRAIIDSIAVYPAPIKTLGSIYISSDAQDLLSFSANEIKLSNTKTGNFLYSTSTNEMGTIILSQAFHKGWHAYLLNGFFPYKLKKHYIVNNWANGWEIEKPLGDNPQRVIFIFWPQLLQFLGFIIAPIVILKMLRSTRW